jgi:hypothetical protein
MRELSLLDRLSGLDCNPDIELGIAFRISDRTSIYSQLSPTFDKEIG